MPSVSSRRGSALVVVAVCAALSMALAGSASAASFAQQATLTASDEVGKSLLGPAVALSHNGSVALVGGPQDNGGVGAAWVFVRRGSAWTELAKLTGAGEVGSGEFGTSVALSSDGKTALIGGPAENKGIGAAWVFRRHGSTWAQDGEKLTGGGQINNNGSSECQRHCGGAFGASVALSSHGETALIGGPGDNEDDGAAWVFTRSGAAWTQEGDKLTGGGEENMATDHGGGPPVHFGGQFGYSVALSSNGNTALISAPRDTTELHLGGELACGATWTFGRSHSTWTQQGNKLAVCPSGSWVGGTWFGSSVALSSNGDLALIGGPESGVPNGKEGVTRNLGLAWSFARSGSTWTPLGEPLRDLAEEQGEFETYRNFGRVLALSSDGGIALVAPGEPLHIAWVFSRSGTFWTQLASPLECEQRAGPCAVALSGDASTALVGTRVYVSRPVPAVASVTPHAGPDRGGTSITIIGSGLANATAVKFGSMSAASFTVNSDGSITAVSPPEAAGTVDVTVANAKGTSATWRGDRFIYVSGVPPTVRTRPAGFISENAANLQGTVNANGGTVENHLAVSDCHFEYGVTASYGLSVPCESLPSGSAPKLLSVTVEGLSAGTTYHFRIVAANVMGTSYGADETFITEG